MNDLVIHISWEYFLGIVGAIITLAYHAGRRLTRLETNLEWISDTVRDLAIRAENASTKLFEAGSPVALTPVGHRHLYESGLRSYIDRHKVQLLSQLPAMGPLDVYRVQEAAFRLLARAPLERPFARRLNQFAFEHGISTDLLRRVAAIYLRDIMAGRP